MLAFQKQLMFYVLLINSCLVQASPIKDYNYFENIQANAFRDIQTEEHIFKEIKTERKDNPLKQEKEENIFDEILKINKDSNELVQGDILKSDRPDDISDNKFKRNAQRERLYLWHDKTVPYEFQSGDYSDDDKEVIRSAFDEISDNSCIKFVPYTYQKSYVRIFRGNGCYSAIGRSFWKDSQLISIGSNCISKGVIMHEVMHTLGFYHEQSRLDRHKYVEIFWENIKDGQYQNFETARRNEMDHQNVEYDYDSIMHYGTKSFSKNGKDTIVPIKQGFSIGNRRHLSPKDIIELNLLYDCQGNVSDYMSTWSGFGPCNDQCKKIRERFCTHSNLYHCPKANHLGVEIEEVGCPHEECYVPVDGHWGRWGDWSKCNVTCGNGHKVRIRDCDNPKPLNNGKNCNGIKVLYSTCSKANCSLGTDDCDFENGMCHWQVTSKAYIWQIYSGETITGNTGPTMDHTFRSADKGHYLYAESSSPASEGMQATITSKIFKNSKNRCMEFWYHAYGLGIGELEVVLNSVKDGNTVQLWSIGGNKGNNWYQKELNVSFATDYQIIFRSTRGSSFLGDIALDDVMFVDCHDKVKEKVPVKQELSVKMMGCYSDDTMVAPRIFPHMVNFRDDIDWNNMNKTLMQCRDHASKEGSKNFGIEFYGECYYGNMTLSSHNSSDNCWKMVGKQNTIMLYEINM